MKNKPLLATIVVIALVVIGGGIFAWQRFSGQSQQPEEETRKRKIAEPLNVIETDDRPYLQIEPLADGRNLNLNVIEVKKEADTMEYELEYQAGTLLQGAFGLIELESLPATAKILLGSCSAGGSCTYHEDVKGGTLLARFEGPESYALKQDWRYFDNAAGDSAFASKDAKFQIESEDLSNQRFIVVYNSPGFPTGLEGTPASDPYSLTVSGTLRGEAELTMRANEEGELTIMGYDGNSWQSFDTTTDGKTATATVDLMELYIVVNQ